MVDITADFIKENNERILAGFTCQARYRAEFTQVKKENKEKLTADERRLLMAVNLYQYKFTLTQIAEVIGFSACKSTRLFKTLEQAGIIKIVKIVKGKGISKYAILLERAYELLNLEEKKFYGKGAGYEHVVWQHLIGEHFKEYKAVIELNRHGKFIDVAIEHENKLIAIEVAMTAVNEKTNIMKDLNIARADRVIVACKDLKVLEEVKQKLFELQEGLRQKTAVYLLGEILKKDLRDL